MRKVIITNNSNLVSFAELTDCPVIKKCWLLPREYTLIELVDPVYRDGDKAREPSTRMAAAIIEEAALFAPFYQRLRSLADVMALHIRTGSASYHLITARRLLLEWPRCKMTTNWDAAEVVNTVCRFTAQSLRPAIQKVFKEWGARMLQLRELTEVLDARSKPGEYAVQCEFSRACGDATMALLMLLSEPSISGSLESVSFRTDTHEIAEDKDGTQEQSNQQKGQS